MGLHRRSEASATRRDVMQHQHQHQGHTDARMMADFESVGMQYRPMPTATASPQCGRARRWLTCSPGTRRMCIVWGVMLYAALVALGAIMAIGTVLYVRPALQSADTAIGKIDRMYSDAQAMLQLACNTPGLLPSDVWAVVCTAGLLPGTGGAGGGGGQP